MLDEAQMGRRQRAVTVLALLLSVLLGHSPAAAGQSQADARLSHAGRALVAGAAIVRASPCEEAEDEQGDRLSLLPPAPKISTETLATRLGTSVFLPRADAALARWPSSNQPRAPPAA